MVGARILEDAGRRVPAILPTGNVASEPAFMTIDTNSFVSMIGNVVPSIEAGNLQEKRALWERFFTLPKFKRDEFFGYDIVPSNFCDAQRLSIVSASRTVFFHPHHYHHHRRRRHHHHHHFRCR